MTGPRYLPSGEILDSVGPADMNSVDLTPAGVHGLADHFETLTDAADRLSAWPNGMIEWPRYTDTGDNEGGVHNHFQGVQRLRAPRYAAISGGDCWKPMSHLFILKFGSRPDAAGWGSNLLYSSKPPPEDKIVAAIGLDSTFWHAGGISVLGDVLAVPIENTHAGGSRIEFLAVTDPERPKRIPCWIERQAHKAGAVALTRLPDERFLVAVWSDSELDATPPKKHLDLYVSSTNDLLNPQWVGPHVFVQEVEHLDKYQTITLIWDLAQGDRWEQLYLVGFHRQGEWHPSLPWGPHKGVLYSVRLPTVVTGHPGALAVTQVQQPQSFDCDGSYCDMDAATGLHAAVDGRLVVHSAYYCLKPVKKSFLGSIFTKREFVLRLSEFRSVAPTHGDVVRSIDNSWIELFDEPDLAGRRLSLFGSDEANIRDFGKIRVQGGGFKKKVTSLRCKIPAGFAYALFPRKNHEGAPLVLMGTGEALRLDDLSGFSFSDCIQSSRYLDPLVAWTKPGRIWVGPQLPSAPRD